MIWDYDQRIDALEEQREILIANSVDPVTGEIAEEAIAEAMQLTMAKADLEFMRDEFLEGLALGVKNLEAEAKAIREEEKNLAERRKALENKAKSREEFLKYCLNGEKFKSSKVAVSYRKTASVETDAEFILWAKENNEYLRFKEPEIDKTAIKDAIKSGKEVPYARIVEKEAMQIK